MSLGDYCIWYEQFNFLKEMYYGCLGRDAKHLATIWANVEGNSKVLHCNNRVGMPPPKSSKMLLFEPSPPNAATVLRKSLFFRKISFEVLIPFMNQSAKTLTETFTKKKKVLIQKKYEL